MTAITPDVISAHQLTEAEYERIVSSLGREPSFTELGIFMRISCQSWGAEGQPPRAARAFWTFGT